jgi:hypothetical protein
MLNVIFFFIPFSTTSEVLSLMAVCKDFKEVTRKSIDFVTASEYVDKEVLCGRTFLNTCYCDACGFDSSFLSRNLRELTHPMRTIIYHQDPPPRRTIIVCKDNWMCIFKALISRAVDSAKYKRFYSIRPLAPPLQNFSIPRSDGSRTIATMLTPSVFVYSKTAGLCSEMYWDTEEGTCSKCVRHRDLLLPARMLTSIEIQVLDKMSTKLNNDVITVIKSFLSHPHPVKCKLASWDLITGTFIK